MPSISGEEYATFFVDAWMPDGTRPAETSVSVMGVPGGFRQKLFGGRGAVRVPGIAGRRVAIIARSSKGSRSSVFSRNVVASIRPQWITNRGIVASRRAASRQMSARHGTVRGTAPWSSARRRMGAMARFRSRGLYGDEAEGMSTMQKAGIAVAVAGAAWLLTRK